MKTIKWLIKELNTKEASYGLLWGTYLACFFVSLFSSPLYFTFLRYEFTSNQLLVFIGFLLLLLDIFYYRVQFTDYLVKEYTRKLKQKRRERVTVKKVTVKGTGEVKLYKITEKTVALFGIYDGILHTYPTGQSMIKIPQLDGCVDPEDVEFNPTEK